MTSNSATLIKKLQAEFRGILLSAGHHGVTIRELMRDYADLNGRPIPLHELGYHDINELLINDMQDVCTFWQNQMGEITLFPISHESTRHIEKLISRQRKNKNKVSRFGNSLVDVAPSGRGGGSRRYRTGTAYKHQVQRHSAVTAKAVPKPVPRIPVSVSNAVRDPSTNIDASASNRSYVSNVNRPSAPVVQPTLQPHAVSMSAFAANKKTTSFSSTPVAQPSNYVPFTTAVVCEPSTNSVVSNSLRSKILQPRFNATLIVPESPTVRHVPLPMPMIPVSFDDEVNLRVPTSASLTFSAARLNCSSRPPIPISFSSRPTLPDTVFRPLVNRMPSPLSDDQITANPATITTTSPSATFSGSVPALSNEQQNNCVRNRFENRKMPSKNQEFYLQLKGNIKIMMEKHSRRGVDVAIFKSAYEDCFNKRINVQELFEMSWRELLLTMDDICYINEYNIVKLRTNDDNANNLRSTTSPPYLAETPSIATTNPNEIHKWLNDSVVAGCYSKSAVPKRSSVSKNHYSFAVDVLPRDFTFAVQKMPSGEDEIQVLMLQCNTPDDFYLELKAYEHELNALMAGLRKYDFNNDMLKVLPNQVQVGMPCAAWFDADGWHRATVLSIDSVTRVTCSYVDFGTVDSVPLERLRFLPSQFKDLPSQAIRAKLAYIQPIDGKQFSQAACEKLIAYTFEKTFWAKIVDQESDDDVVAVILTTTYGDTDVHINDQLIIENLVKLPLEMDFSGLNDLSCDDIADDSVVCDEDFGFDPNASKEVFANDSLPSEPINWEDELEAMPDDSSDSSEQFALCETAFANVDVTPFLLPELETEVMLVKRARAMVADRRAPTDSLQIIRTVVGMRRSALCKLFAMGTDSPSDIVDKLDWLEEQIRWLDEQLYEPEEPC